MVNLIYYKLFKNFCYVFLLKNFYFIFILSYILFYLVNNFFTENDFLNLEEIEKSILLTNLRIKALKKLEIKSQVQAQVYSQAHDQAHFQDNIEDFNFSIDDLQQIKNNNSLFNTIFKLKEYDLLISENVFNKLNKEYLKKILINICHILSIPKSNFVDDKENYNYENYNKLNNDELNHIILEKATKEKKLQTFFNKYFNKIINILLAKKDFFLLEVFAEGILNCIPRKEIPLDMVNYL
jgi:hypothetical protein